MVIKWCIWKMKRWPFAVFYCITFDLSLALEEWLNETWPWPRVCPRGAFPTDFEPARQGANVACVSWKTSLFSWRETDKCSSGTRRGLSSPTPLFGKMALLFFWFLLFQLVPKTDLPPDTAGRGNGRVSDWKTWRTRERRSGIQREREIMGEIQTEGKTDKG